MHSTLKQLDAAAIDTYLVHDPPAPNPEVIDCLFWKSRFDADPHACSYFPDSAADSSISALEANAAQGLLHVHLVNLNSFICNREPCSLFSNGLLVYRDDHHLAVDFSRTLAPAFVRLFASRNGVSTDRVEPGNSGRGEALRKAYADSQGSA